MVVLQTVTSYHFKHSRKKLRKLKKLDTHVLLQRPLCTGYWEFPIPVNSFINAAAFSYRSREVIVRDLRIVQRSLARRCAQRSQANYFYSLRICQPI